MWSSGALETSFLVFGEVVSLHHITCKGMTAYSICLYICTMMSTYTHIPVCKHMYVCMYIHIHTSRCICRHAYRMRLYTNMYKGVCICVYTYVYIHTDVYRCYLIYIYAHADQLHMYIHDASLSMCIQSKAGMHIPTESCVSAASVQQRLADCLQALGSLVLYESFILYLRKLEFPKYWP